MNRLIWRALHNLLTFLIKDDALFADLRRGLLAITEARTHEQSRRGLYMLKRTIERRVLSDEVSEAVD